MTRIKRSAALLATTTMLAVGATASPAVAASVPGNGDPVGPIKGYDTYVQRDQCSGNGRLCHGYQVAAPTGCPASSDLRVRTGDVDLLLPDFYPEFPTVGIDGFLCATE